MLSVTHQQLPPFPDGVFRCLPSLTSFPWLLPFPGSGEGRRMQPPPPEWVPHLHAVRGCHSYQTWHHQRKMLNHKMLRGKGSRPLPAALRAVPTALPSELLLYPTFFCPGMCAGRTGCAPRNCAQNGDGVTSSWQHVQISWSLSNLMQADVSRVLAALLRCV